LWGQKGRNDRIDGTKLEWYPGSRLYDGIAAQRASEENAPRGNVVGPNKDRAKRA